MKEGFVAYIGGALAVLLFFLPWMLDPIGTIPSTYPDAWAFVWNLDRLASVWSGQESLYFTERIFHPFGAPLALHTQAEAVLLPSSLFVNFSSVELVYSFAVIICFLLNFISCALLFSYLSKNSIIGSFLGALLALHPHFIGHLEGGHINFLAFFPFAFWLRSYLKLVRDDGSLSVDGTVLVLTTTMLAFTNLYYLFFLALVAASLSLFFIGAGTLSALWGVLVAGFATVFGVVLSFPKLFLVVGGYQDATFKENHAPLEHSADVAFYFVPSINQFLSQFTSFSLNPFMYGLSSVELGVYLGLALTLLVLYFLSRKTTDPLLFTFLTTALLFVVLSFGPEVRITGHLIVEDPLYLMLSKASFFPSVPIRFGFIAVFLLFCLVAFGLRAGTTKISAALLLLLMIEMVPRQLPLGVIPKPSSLYALAQMDEVSAVHDFSVGRQHKLAYQLTHQKKVTSAFLARTPLEPVQFYKENAFLRYVRRGKEASKKALSGAIEALQIQAVICEWGKPKCEERVLSTGRFEKVTEDDYLRIYSLK